MTEKELLIQISDNNIPGKIKYLIDIINKESLMRIHRFKDEHFSLKFYLDMVDFELVYPVAWVSDIVVPLELRDRGLGTLLLREFEAEALKSGAKTGMLRVGFDGDGDSWKEERKKNLHFYRSRGWQVAEPDSGPIIAFKQLH